MTLEAADGRAFTAGELLFERHDGVARHPREQGAKPGDHCSFGGPSRHRAASASAGRSWAPRYTVPSGS